MDTGASAHMNYNSGNITSLSPSDKSILVGIVSDKLIQNLISVRRFTIDNWVSVSFDPFGFTMKDFKTGAFLQRCNSHGELYPVVPSSSPLAASATALSQHCLQTHSIVDLDIQ
ncbi:hypothetical protein Tco_1536770, partial [Tanacetum coccineum]